MHHEPAPTAEDRAILRLSLRRGQSYEAIATALASDVPAVRARAHAALTALAPCPAALTTAERERLADALLTADLPAAGTLLTEAAENRAWWERARDRLVTEGLADADRIPPAQPDGGATASAGTEASGPEQVRVSRRGGLLVLAVVVAALALIAAALFGGFRGRGAQPAGTQTDRPTATSTTTTGTSTTAAGGAEIVKQINLKPPSGAGSPLGILFVVQQDGKRALQVLGQGLAAGNMYALWMQKDGRWSRLGFFPAVTAKGTDAGRLVGLVAAPKGALASDRVVVSRETAQSSTEPGEIVLAGRIKG